MVTPQSVSTTISLDEFSCEKISSRKMVAPCAGRPVPRLVPLAVGGLAGVAITEAGRGSLRRTPE